MQIERGHGALLTAICASLFCAPLMVAGVNAVLPEIGASLRAGAAQLSLVGAAYSLGLTIFQLACGSMGDIAGHKRIFLCGCIVFCVCGFALGFMESIQPFLILRFVQGIGGAMLSAAGLALLASCVSSEKRSIYLGYSGTAVYAGIACGPPIAGFIAEYLGWRWIFWINAMASVAIFALMKGAVRHEWRPAPGKHFDWKGCAYYSMAMGCLTYGAARLGADSLAGWLSLGAFAAFLLVFWRHESRCSFPMLNPAMLLNNRVLSLSSLAAFMNYASFFGMVFYFSFYLQVGKGMSVREAGFILAIQSVAQAMATPLASRLCQRGRPGIVSACGAAICGFGLIAASFLRLDSSLLPLFGAQILLGFGISLFSLSNTSIILESAGREGTGQAAALTGAMRTAGQLCCMSLITLTLGLFMGAEAVSRQTLPGFMEGMRVDLMAFGGLNILAVGLALARNRR